MKDTSYRSIQQRSQSFRAGQLVLLGIGVGVVSGLGAIVFNFFVFGATDLFLINGLGWSKESVSSESFLLIPAEGLRYWLLPLVPALGGLIGGLLVFTFAPEAEGHGTDAYIRSFHRLRGRIRARVPVIKTIASAITIGTGGSAGREGPIAQIGAGFGSWLGQVLNLDAQDCRTLLIAGTAGGVGAIFSAPLGGVLFAIEVLYRNQEMETEGLIPALVASLVSFSVFSYLTGQSQVFHTPAFEFHIWELLPYTLLGVVCAGVGIIYVLVFYGARDYFFRKLPVAPHFLPMIGGLLLGGLALMVPEVLGGGYGLIERALNENLGVQFMLLLVVAKLLATSLTISSGGSGGVFGPSLFIGCMLGGALGYILEGFFPGWIGDPRSFTLVGMVAFFSGIAKVPVASLLMVTEMTQSYTLLVPMMLVSSITYLLTPHWSLYEEQVWSKADSPVHFGEYNTDVLAGLKVNEIEFSDGIKMIPHTSTMRQLLPVVLESNQFVFPVVDKENKIMGMFSMDDIRSLLLEEQVHDLIVAMDIAMADYVSVSPDEDLHSVLRKMTDLASDEIPIIEKESNQFKGTLKRSDILSLYSRKLYELEQRVQLS